MGCTITAPDARYKGAECRVCHQKNIPRPVDFSGSGRNTSYRGEYTISCYTLLTYEVCSHDQRKRLGHSKTKKVYALQHRRRQKFPSLINASRNPTNRKNIWQIGTALRVLYGCCEKILSSEPTKNKTGTENLKRFRRPVTQTGFTEAALLTNTSSC